VRLASGVIDCNERKTEKRHECANMGKVKRLQLWWQLYRTSLPVRDLENFRPKDFCSTECTCIVSEVETFWFVMACAVLGLEFSSTRGCNAGTTGKEIQTFRRIYLFLSLWQEITKEHPPFLLNSAKLKPVRLTLSTSVVPEVISHAFLILYGFITFCLHYSTI